MFDGPTTLGLKLDNQTVFLESVTGSEWQCSSKVSLPPTGTSGAVPKPTPMDGNERPEGRPGKNVGRTGRETPWRSP
jgi:hypothetical protein